MQSDPFIPTEVVYHLAEQAKSSGAELHRAPGPWRARERRITRPGRHSLHTIPIVTNERAEVMVDTVEHASDVAGLLNWCGVHELDPVPGLVPPAEPSASEDETNSRAPDAAS
jgi:hypothetical protein